MSATFLILCCTETLEEISFLFQGGQEAQGVGANREVKEYLQRDETSLPSLRRSSSLPQLPITSSTSCSMDEVLQLVTQLYINTEIVDKYSEEFLSTNISKKLITQI